MPTQLRCPRTPILGSTIRIAKLNSCGVTVTGASSAVLVLDSWTQVQAAAQYDTGDRKITRKANGLLCVNTKLPDVFTNEQLTIDLCAWNPGVMVETLGATLITATESPTGTGNMFGVGMEGAHWSLELWSGIDGDPCDASGNPLYFYAAWPHLSDGKLGDRAWGNDPTNMQIMANSLGASSLWTLGNSWLGSGQVQSGHHFGWNYTTTAPPTVASCVIGSI
jgi:hypothetical protein